MKTFNRALPLLVIVLASFLAWKKFVVKDQMVNRTVKEQRQPQVERVFSPTIDFSQCNLGESYSIAHGLGSNSIMVSKSMENNCVVNYTAELEGGYSIYECLVPKSIGLVDFEALGSFDPILEYCSEEPFKQGNVFLDQ